MPIMIQGNVIGVVQMVNKKNGFFTKSDEESFETFAVYCGLALHHASLYERIRRSEQKCKVALEVLSYHASCSNEEYDRLKTHTIPENIPHLELFEFSPWSVDNEMKPIYVLYMFQDIAQLDPINANRFDMESLTRFVLTVRKNYRNVPYHNWSHAFSVAHAMYTMIKQTKHKFTPNQVRSMNANSLDKSFSSFLSSVLLCLLLVFVMMLIIVVKQMNIWLKVHQHWLRSIRHQRWNDIISIKP